MSISGCSSDKIDKDLSPVLRQKCFIWDKPLWKRNGLPCQRVEN